MFITQTNRNNTITSEGLAINHRKSVELAHYTETVKLESVPNDSEAYVCHHLPTNRAKSQSSKTHTAEVNFEDIENLLLLYSLCHHSNWILTSWIRNLTSDITITKDIKFKSYARELTLLNKSQ